MKICFQTWRFRTVLGMLFVERHGWRYIMVVEWDGKALTRIMTETSIEQLSTFKTFSVYKTEKYAGTFSVKFFITKYLYTTLIFCLNWAVISVFPGNELSYHEDLLGLPSYIKYFIIVEKYIHLLFQGWGDERWIWISFGRIYGKIKQNMRNQKKP